MTHTSLSLMAATVVLQAAEPGRSVSVVHVVNSKEAFQQQKVDVLWRLVSPQAFTHLQVRNSCLFGDGAQGEMGV